jgi:hypothetical protein
VRLPPDLAARVEVQRALFAREHAVPMTFADAVRTLLDVALIGEEEREEEEHD